MEKPHHQTVKLSVCLVAYNEERVIRACLDSVKNIADEIVFVHDGEPKDATVTITKEYTDNIYIPPNTGYLEGNLPFAYSKCTGEWIMQIDADERLSPELQAIIPILLDRTDVDGFAFSIPSVFGQTVRDKDLIKPFLFRRTTAFAYGLPHFVRGTTGKMETRPEHIYHQPAYDNYTWKTFRTKWLRLARKHAELLSRDPDSLPRYGPLDMAKIHQANQRVRGAPLLYGVYKFAATWGYAVLHFRWWNLHGLKRTVLYACYEWNVYYYLWQLLRTTPPT